MNATKVFVGIVGLMMIASSFAFLSMGTMNGPSSSSIPENRVAGSSPRTVLVESFTATHCTFCPPHTHTLERLTEELGKDKIIILESHPSGGSDPMGCTIPWNMIYDYENMTGYSIPYVVFDGGGSYTDGRNTPPPLSNSKYYPYTTDKQIFTNEYADLTSLTMSMEGDMNGTTGSLHIHLDFTDVPSETNLKLRVRITENNMYWYGLGTSESAGHHRDFSNVARYAFSDIAIPTGVGPGTHLEYNMTFTPDAAWQPNMDVRRLAAVAYVQTTNTYYEVGHGHKNHPVLQSCFYEFVHPSILLVNADDTDVIDNGIDHFSEELRKIQKPLEMWDTNEPTDTYLLNDRTMPTAAEMQKYGTVIWDCGKDTTTLSATDRTNVESYLAGGGSFFLTGSNIAEDANANGWNSWLQTSFKATYVAANTGVSSINGVAGDPIGDGMQWQKLETNSPDEINPFSGGSSSFTYNGTVKNAAVRGTHSGGGRTVYFGCNYFLASDTIDTIPQDETILQRILSWQDQASAPKVDVLYPDGGETFLPGNQITIRWKATDTEVLSNGIDLSYCTDYPTATWVTIATNMLNDGTYKWTVPTAASLTCRVRALARDGQGNTGSAFSGGNFAIGTPPPPRWVNITVIAGWNLVSVNLTGPTTMPAALTDKVGGVVWTRALWYNPQTPADPWKQYSTTWNTALNDLISVDNKIGVWLYVTTVGDGQICVGGTGYSLPSSTNIQLRAGWNLVGFPSDDATYSVAMLKAAAPGVDIVEQFNGAQTYKTSVMADANFLAPDKAYWVHTTADVIWTKAY